MTDLQAHDEPGEESNQDEKVGYGRPPRHSQFKPGRSGNPRGRIKSKRTMQSIVNALLDQKIWVSLPSGKKQVTVEEGIFLRLRELALKGDLKAVQFLLDRRHPPTGSHETTASGDRLSQDDLAILAAVGLFSHSEQQSDGSP